MGLTDGSFAFRLADHKLSTVLRKISEQNNTVTESGRDYATVVYLTGLTAATTAEGRVAQSEALAGVAARQRHQLTGALPLRILIANGGTRMEHGTTVARMVAREAERDRTIIGVAGLGQSRQATIDTIRVLHRAGLPMVAAALTANGMADASQLYFQVSPDNTREAAIAANFARQDQELAAVNKVWIVAPDEPADLYSNTLADAAQTAFSGKGFAVERRVYRPDPHGSQPVDPASSVGAASCGRAGIAFYAGRTKDFGEFLRGIQERCGDKPPFILAGDDISRYAADPESRNRYPAIPFTFISLAVGAPGCEGSTVLPTTLRSLFPEECRNGPDPSLDGHAALAFDATSILMKAADDLKVRGLPVTSGAVGSAIPRISGDNSLHGESGRIDYGAADGRGVPVDKAVSAVHVPGANLDPLVKAYCGAGAAEKAQQWCPPSSDDDSVVGRHRGK